MRSKQRCAAAIAMLGKVSIRCVLVVGMAGYICKSDGLKRAFPCEFQYLAAIKIYILKSRLCLFYQTVCMMTALHYDSYNASNISYSNFRGCEMAPPTAITT